MTFATKLIWQYPPHLRHVATLPRENKNSICSRCPADMEENANKLHFKCTAFNSSMRVTVFWLHLCVFIKILSWYIYIWISCWLLTDMALTSAETNFQCHKLIAKVNNKTTVNWKFYLQSVWGTTCKEAIKNAICLHFLPYVLNISSKFAFLISQGSVAANADFDRFRLTTSQP